ncbi:MAG: ParB/RepB/Spo0J family partition protein [Sphingobium sp.]|jgi:ParB family chromosome partitioning protein|nr:ParB/RepB/Spo0J family partition protein [Sphingobium sp.]MCI1270344.1 ParB/RepB/Spo0J family partition protein [Sphingobium sp.]MCI1755491.1 ParB/RepB/Spo0J family partition protein [Sphingobium sp.]MCI2052131.1 ParB/RepB/Spo0J family partition protein [Sphingobium sp.]
MSDNAGAGSEKTKAHGRPRGLGRGLSALLGETLSEEAGAVRAEGSGPAPVSGKSVQYIDIAAISPHPDQPRRTFDEAALQELTDSVSERGVIQPVLVREQSPGRYQLVAGERRWRAAQRARLHQIPAIVRDFSDAETMEIALIENVQRQDLNPVEEAEAYSRLIAQFGHSQEVLGKLVGKSRSHVANLMRLLDLPASVLDIVRGGQLSMGHARALIGVDGAAQIARQVVAKGLSVRQVEKLAQKAKGRTPAATEKGARAGAAARDADIVALEQHLADLIGVKVSIDHSAQGSGTLSLRYSTLDQLDMLCQRLSGDAI